MTLSDSRRRTLIRGLFLCTCVLPCLVTLAWGWVVRSDAYRDAWQESIAVQLGMRVTVAQVRTPRPGTLLLENVRGYDPETDAQVFACRTLEIEEYADGRHLRASQPEIDAVHGARLFAALERRLRRETRSAETAVTFEAAELTWRVGGESQTLVDVDALAGPAESAQQLLVNFALPGTPAEHPVSLRIARHTSAQPETTVELDTGAVVLPCAAFAPLTDVVDVLGPRARFAGRLKLRQTAAGWNGVVAGDVTEADLDTLVSQRFPHVLSGSAELQIHRAEVAGGRLEHAEFTIEAGPGQMSRSLAESVGRHLGLAGAAAPFPAGSMLLFDRLALDGAIIAGGLTIKARTNERQGAILRQGDVVYWREPPPGVQSTAQLLRALAPAAELQVPAVAATAALVPWLSIVESGKAMTSQNGDAGTLPTAVRLRVRDIPAADDPLRR